MSNIVMSAEFLAKAKAAKSFEELKALVTAESIEIAEDELMARWEEISASAKKFKLSEEELENVAGGCGPEYNDDGVLCYDGYAMVNSAWAPTCHSPYYLGHDEGSHYQPLSEGTASCGNCALFVGIGYTYDGRNGYCKR